MRINPDCPERTEIFFNHLDVLAAVKKMPNGAAPGPDGKTQSLLKQGGTSNALWLNNVLKSSFKSSKYQISKS